MTGIASFQGRYPANADGPWIVPSYSANWSDVGGGFQTRRYRKIGTNKVRVEGYAIRSTSVSGASSTILNLPAGFRPSAAQVLQMSQNAGGAITSNQIYIDSSGNIICSNSVAVGVAVPFTGEFYID